MVRFKMLELYYHIRHNKYGIQDTNINVSDTIFTNNEFFSEGEDAGVNIYIGGFKECYPFSTKPKAITEYEKNTGKNIQPDNSTIYGYLNLTFDTPLCTITVDTLMEYQIDMNYTASTTCIKGQQDVKITEILLCTGNDCKNAPGTQQTKTKKNCIKIPFWDNNRDTINQPTNTTQKKNILYVSNDRQSQYNGYWIEIEGSTSCNTKYAPSDNKFYQKVDNKGNREELYMYRHHCLQANKQKFGEETWYGCCYGDNNVGEYIWVLFDDYGLMNGCSCLNNNNGLKYNYINDLNVSVIYTNEHIIEPTTISIATQFTVKEKDVYSILSQASTSPNPTISLDTANLNIYHNKSLIIPIGINGTGFSPVDPLLPIPDNNPMYLANETYTGAKSAMTSVKDKNSYNTWAMGQIVVIQEFNRFVIARNSFNAPISVTTNSNFQSIYRDWCSQNVSKDGVPRVLVANPQNCSSDLGLGKCLEFKGEYIDSKCTLLPTVDPLNIPNNSTHCRIQEDTTMPCIASEQYAKKNGKINPAAFIPNSQLSNAQINYSKNWYKKHEVNPLEIYGLISNSKTSFLPTKSSIQCIPPAMIDGMTTLKSWSTGDKNTANNNIAFNNSNPTPIVCSNTSCIQVTNVDIGVSENSLNIIKSNSNCTQDSNIGTAKTTSEDYKNIKKDIVDEVKKNTDIVTYSSIGVLVIVVIIAMIVFIVQIKKN